MEVFHLRVESLLSPVGIDVVKPRFSWLLKGAVKQKSYQIVCKSEGANIWDSGKVSSDQISFIPYEGPVLKSRNIVSVTVTSWNEKDETGTASASFEMGLLNKEDWKAKWIKGDYEPEEGVAYPVDCFLKEYKLKGQVKKARLYITSFGIYEARINGMKAGDMVLQPGVDNYNKILHYQTFDVASLLKEENRLTVELSDGYYRGSVGYQGLLGVYGNIDAFLYQLEIEYEDGTKDAVCSDKTWKWSNDGPILFADMKDGEDVDLNKEPSYKGEAVEVEKNIVPSASNNGAMKEKDVFKGEVSVKENNLVVYDFKQNLAGFLHLKIKGRKGQKIKITLAETTDEKGHADISRLLVRSFKGKASFFQQLSSSIGMTKKIPDDQFKMTPRQEIHLICTGNVDEYKTKFAISGFQFAQVESNGPFDVQEIASIAVYSDMEKTYSFDCSNKKINRLVKNAEWAMLSNFSDIPTDCPTRERSGWTGDAQIFFNTASFMYDVESFFIKWLKDIEKEQLKDGRLPSIIPSSGITSNYCGGSVGWSDAAVLIPYRYYKKYGDKAFLKRFYPIMKKYGMFMINNSGKDDGKVDMSMMEELKPEEAQALSSLRGQTEKFMNKKVEDEPLSNDPDFKYIYEKGFHYGEWLEPKEFCGSLMETPSRREEATAYMSYVLGHLSEVSSILGEKEDASLFKEYSDGARRIYGKMFIKDGNIDTQRQAKIVRPLALHLYSSDSEKKNLQASLLKALKARNYGVTTGFLSTPFLLPELTKAGHSDIAYKVLENENYPSWLYEVDHGATTIWESWEGKDSLNHYSPGSVCEWLFVYAGGIRKISPNRFELSPVVGGGLNYLDISYLSKWGEVKVSWKRKDNGEYSYSFTVPSNCTALIKVGSVEKEVESGTYYL